MTINEFIKKHGDRSENINTVLKKWAFKKEIDDFLGTPIMGGYLVGDLLIGDGLPDAISSDLKEGFSELMKEKADSYEEIRNIIIQKDDISIKSILGLKNKIQGQLGENLFKENVEGAELARSGSQEAYDIFLKESSRHIQVKVYEDANSVIDKIQEVNEKVDAGLIDEYGNKITQVDFAVNKDILEEVRNKAEDLGLPNQILDLRSDRKEIRNIIEKGFEEVTNPGIVDFFRDLFGSAMTVTALHGAINGYFLWKGAKSKQEAIEDTFYSSMISTGGLMAAHLVEAIFLENVALMLGGPILLISGIGTRTILKRFLDRRYVLKRLIEGNLKLKNYCTCYE